MRTSTAFVALCGVLVWGCGTPRNDDSATGGAGGVSVSKPGSGGSVGSGGKTSESSGGNSGSGSGGQVSGSGGSAGLGGNSGSGGAASSSGGTTGSGGAAPDASGTSDSASGDGPVSADPGPSIPGAFPNCPNCKSLFDGKTLDGWTANSETYAVMDGAMLSTGKARGFLATNQDYQNFRLIFSNKLLGGGHAQNMLLWCQKPYPNNACGGIQFQPPGGSMWDYRKGIDKNVPATAKMKVGSSGATNMEWSQCEILAKGTTGEFRVACCKLTGNTPCKGIEILRYKDATVAGSKGPIAWQAHNPGHRILWKDVFIEVDPVVDDLITTK